MMRLILGVAAALLLTVAQAAADGLPSKGHVKGVTAAAPNWTGFYVGVGIGAGAVVSDVSFNRGSRELFGLDGIGAEGVFGTVTVGYDRVIRPGWVAGVFADYDFGSNISTDISHLGSIDLDHAWSIGGRAGFLTSPSTLVYGTVGYTQAEFDFFGATSETFDGFFVGAGIETLLRQDWTLKLEYRYTQFDDVKFGDPDCFNIGFEPSSHTARLVLSYKLPYHRD